MNIRIATAAVCAAIGMSAAGIAIAQAAWPQITRADLEACRNVIAQAHKKEYDFINVDITSYCTSGSSRYDTENCKTVRDWLAETKAKDDVDWYFKGNDHCEGGDYPCFGPALYNDVREGDDRAYWANIFAEQATRTQIVTPAMEVWDATDAAGSCTAALWTKKYKAMGGTTVVATPRAQPAQPVQPVAAPTPARVTATDPAFQSNIKTFGADQLLALTNELLENGNIDVAKLARNALLQRFPDSPLVPIVAQLITAATKTGTPAATPTPAPGSALTAPAATGDRVHINDGPSLISAFARAGVLMKAIPNSEEFQEGSNLFSAYLSNCSNGQCHAVQIIAKYSFNLMPSFDKVQAWNLKKLYGRAYIDNNRVNFDMVILIPNAGIDIKALEEAIVLYKEASSAFYDSVKPQ